MNEPDTPDEPQPYTLDEDEIDNSFPNIIARRLMRQSMSGEIDE